MDLVEALAIRRKELGLKYEELSEKSKVPVNTLKKIFTGNIAAPSFESIKSIAYAMDMTLEELDRRIEERSDFSENDIAMLKAISALDAPGRAAVQAVLDTQQQRIKEYGPAVKRALTGTTRRIPLMQSSDESEIQISYHAKREQRELEQPEETLQPIDAESIADLLARAPCPTRLDS